MIAEEKGLEPLANLIRLQMINRRWRKRRKLLSEEKSAYPGRSRGEGKDILGGSFFRMSLPTE